MIEQLC